MNANQRRRNNNNNNNNTSTRARIVNRNGSLLVRVSVVLIHWFSSEGTMHQVPPFNCENAGHSKNVLRCWPDIRKRTRTDLIESIRLDRQRQQQLLNYVEYLSVFIILFQFVTVFVILSVVPSSKHSLLVSFLAPICLTSLFSNYRWRAISISSSTATACVAVAAVLLSLKADVSAFVGIHYDNVAAFVCCAVLCWLIWICSPHWLDILAKSNAQFTIDLVTTSKRVLRHQTFKRRRFYSYLVSCLNTFWFRHWQRHCHLSVSDLLTQWIPIGRTTWWKQLCFIRRMLTANQHHSAAVCSDVLQPLTKHNSPQFTLNEVKKEATWSSIKLPTVHKLINLSDRGKKLSRSSSNASSPSRASKILLALLIQSRLIVSSTSTTVLSGGGSGHFQQLTAESLNPWLSADGGLILRAISAANNNQNSLSLNWIRSNAGACVPQPTTLACPSDRYCRLPEIASGNLAGSRETSAFFDRSFRPTTTTATSAMNEGEQDAASQTIAPETAVANASQCLPYLRPTNKSSSSSSTNRSKSSSSGSSNSSIPSPVECICGHVDGAKRIDALRKYHLHHCYHYKLWYVLSDTMLEGIARSRSQCYAYLAVVEQLDNLAAHFVCQFEDIIRRYDCAQTFSSKSSCQQCKVAYRQWACSMILPIWLDGERIKPCRSFCHEVERLCPYFLPAEKTGPGSQYAGEPSFSCIDPDVRETVNQSMNSAYSDKSCYRPCTLDYSLEPDVDPSVCVSSLYGDNSNPQEDETDTRMDTSEVESVDCLHLNKNVTRLRTDDDDSEIDNLGTVQCQSFNLKEQLVTRKRVTNGVRTQYFFDWRWRTSVLPYILLLLYVFI